MENSMVQTVTKGLTGTFTRVRMKSLLSWGLLLTTKLQAHIIKVTIQISRVICPYIHKDQSLISKLDKFYAKNQQ